MAFVILTQEEDVEGEYYEDKKTEMKMRRF